MDEIRRQRRPPSLMGLKVGNTLYTFGLSVEQWERICKGAKRFWRRNGVSIVALVLFAAWTAGVASVSCCVTERNVRKEVTEQLSAEYDARMQQYIEQEEAIYRTVGDGSMQAQISREAELVAQVIGHMDSERAKLTEIWNILMRVDSPMYPNTVEDVVLAKGQWTFFDPDGANPTYDSDINMAEEQLKQWHNGRYPSGLDISYVYGEWMPGDYVLRNQWEKTSAAEYWRYPINGQ